MFSAIVVSASRHLLSDSIESILREDGGRGIQGLQTKRGHTDGLLGGLCGVGGSLLGRIDTGSKGFSDLLV